MAQGALPCDDFSQFTKVLYELRKVDDAVVTELNELMPTSSFRNSVDLADRCISFRTMV
jgi:hypothetical protein